MASPQKRIKVPPPLNPLLHPSKLPVRNGSTLTTTPATSTLKTSLYGSPVRAKPAIASIRHSPYGERAAMSKTNGNSVDVTIGKLNFRATAGRFRRAGGPRLSQSPARRSSFFAESSPASVPIRLEESESSSREDAKSESEDSIVLSRESKGKGREPVVERPPEAKVPAQDSTERITAENEALRNLVEARVNALRMEIEHLTEQVQKEQARVESDTRGVPRPESDVEAMINRLLAANDSSHTTLPRLEPAPDPGIPSARPLTTADPISQLSAFHCLTFTSTTTTVSTPAEPSSPESPLIQRHTTHGYSANRLLFFTLAFTVTASSWTVSNVTYDISAWAQRELRPALTLAAQESDINTILYALSSYTTLVQKRAAVFSRLSHTFPHLLPVFVPSRGNPLGRRDIVPWLGTALLRFRTRDKSGGVELIMTWDITIGVGGEAESVVHADVRVPAKWTEIDEMGAFSKVGEVFGLLVRERGVFEATKCVVKLMFQ